MREYLLRRKSATAIVLSIVLSILLISSITQRQFLIADARGLAVDSESATAQFNAVNVSAASFRAGALARGSIAALFGENFEVGNIRQPIVIRELNGVRHNVDRIFFRSRNQINYLIPDDLPVGLMETIIGTGESRALLYVTDVSSGIFTANSDGKGAPAGLVLRIRNGVQTYENFLQYNSSTGRMECAPIDLGDAGDLVFLILFGTGFKHASGDAFAYFNNLRTKVSYYGSQGSFDGLDQVNILIPPELRGEGDVTVNFANPTTINIR